MKRTTKYIGYGFVLVSALAACGHPSPEDSAAWMVKKVSKELALDESQLTKLNAVKDEVLTLRKEWHEQRQASRSTALALLDKPTLDRQQAIDLINGHTRFVEEKAPELVAVVGDFYDSLTPQQQQTLRKDIKERMEHHHRHWDRD